MSNWLLCYLKLLQGASELLAGASILGCSADDFVNDVSLIKIKHDKSLFITILLSTIEHDWTAVG